MLQNGHRPFLTKICARLGLLALALQLVLSFGHIHPLPSSVTTISAPAGKTAPNLPLAGDDCAICASMAAFATLDTPHQDDLSVPGEATETLAPLPVSRDYPAATITYFSSRAPPAA